MNDPDPTDPMEPNGEREPTIKLPLGVLHSSGSQKQGMKNVLLSNKGSPHRDAGKGEDSTKGPRAKMLLMRFSQSVDGRTAYPKEA
jgi:hypothetical protein